MPVIRIDKDVAALLAKDLRKLRRTNKGKFRAASVNDVIRVWLGLNPPRAGVRRRTKEKK